MSTKNSTLMSHAIAFYNTENLFDFFDNEKINDSDFTPRADKRWTKKRYQEKLNKIGYTISNIGETETQKHPALIGLAEVENKYVLNDLIASKHLKDCHYKYIHYNSKDERGIDVALLYDTSIFKVTNSKPFSIELFRNSGKPDYTRDILLVSGLLNGEEINIIINHWSSRREGQKETEHKRVAASNKVGEIISTLKNENENAQIIVMGDFNDNPTSYSVKRLVDGFDLENPMTTLKTYSRGTTRHKRQWFLFDQIFFSKNFLNVEGSSLHFKKADIFDALFLKKSKGKYKGSPFRTYLGPKYQAGYSDHFPVYAVFEVEN